MAKKHILALDIPDTACDHILKIWDSSVYSDVIPVECSLLEITLPGFYQPNYITDVEPNFILNLSTIELGISSDYANPLPDGIYHIKYSVSPNSKVFVEYSHLRVTCLLNEYYRELCKIRLEPCEATEEKKQKIEKLRYIKMLIDASKAKVEYCDMPNDGLSMFKYARKLLSEFQTGKCGTC